MNPVPSNKIGVISDSNTQKVGEIPQRLQRIEGCINDLHCRITQLQQALDAVLSTENPCSTAEPSASPLTRLGSTLSNIELGVEQASSRINDLLCRIEL